MSSLTTSRSSRYNFGSSLLDERGVTMAEQAFVLPLWISLVLLLRDVFFIGYTWASLQYAVDEGLRRAILGTKSTLSASATQSEKEWDIKDRTLRKILAAELRTGIINSSSVDYAQVESNSDGTYGWDVMDNLAVSDSTAHQDLLNTFDATVVHPKTDPFGWWVNITAQRTLKSSEGKLTALSGAVLKLATGYSEITLTAKGAGRLEKPLS